MYIRVSEYYLSVSYILLSLLVIVVFSVVNFYVFSKLHRFFIKYFVLGSRYIKLGGCILVVCMSTLLIQLHNYFQELANSRIEGQGDLLSYYLLSLAFVYFNFLRKIHKERIAVTVNTWIMHITVIFVIFINCIYFWGITYDGNGNLNV